MNAPLRNPDQVWPHEAIPHLADRLIAASAILHTCPDAEWDRANAAHADAQAEFRAAIERVTGMPLTVLERAMGEL